MGAGSAASRPASTAKAGHGPAVRPHGARRARDRRQRALAHRCRVRQPQRVPAAFSTAGMSRTTPPGDSQLVDTEDGGRGRAQGRQAAVPDRAPGTLPRRLCPHLLVAGDLTRIPLHPQHHLLAADPGRPGLHQRPDALDYRPRAAANAPNGSCPTTPPSWPPTASTSVSPWTGSTARLATPTAVEPVRVLLFDVFGTLVDWRSSLIGIAGDRRGPGPAEARLGRRRGRLAPRLPARDGPGPPRRRLARPRCPPARDAGRRARPARHPAARPPAWASTGQGLAAAAAVAGQPGRARIRLRLRARHRHVVQRPPGAARRPARSFSPTSASTPCSRRSSPPATSPTPGSTSPRFTCSSASPSEAGDGGRRTPQTLEAAAALGLRPIFIRRPARMGAWRAAWRDPPALAGSARSRRAHPPRRGAGLLTGNAGPLARETARAVADAGGRPMAHGGAELRRRRPSASGSTAWPPSRRRSARARRRRPALPRPPG